MKGSREPLFKLSLSSDSDGFNPTYIELGFNHPRIFFADSLYWPPFAVVPLVPSKRERLEHAARRFLEMISKELDHQIEQLLKVNAVPESKSTTEADRRPE